MHAFATNAFQPSLFDGLESAEHPTLGALTGLERIPLSNGAWLDLLPTWVHGADRLFEELLAEVPWRSESRPMYDRVVAVPRLVHTYGVGADLPHPTMETAMTSLSRHYADELGEPFVTAGCCLYRDGGDSVAWHGDNVGRGRRHDTMVAILSLGSPRTLQLRPRGGGRSVGFSLGHGDLLVMGGSCQRTW